MYDFFSRIINHSWQTGQYADGAQSYIVTACCVLIVLLTIFVLKLFSSWLSYVLNVYRH